MAESEAKGVNMIHAIKPIERKKPWRTVLLDELDAMLAKDLPIKDHCVLAWIRARLRGRAA